MCKAAADGNLAVARSLHYELRDINDVLFIDTNPVPVKTALYLMGKIENEFRAPLCELSQAHLEKIKEVLERHELLVGK
jgi:4-hydroxy-tetrahydrodipicolinate synthase